MPPLIFYFSSESHVERKDYNDWMKHIKYQEVENV